MTFGLVLANLVGFVVELLMREELPTFLLRWGLVPVEITGGESGPVTIITFLTSLFLHTGWLHLLVNLLYLAVFGSGVERALGGARFLVLYLLGGIAGGVAHVVTAPMSDVPAVGASGAVAATIAAYLVLYPGATLGSMAPVLFFAPASSVPALVLLVLWLLAQLFGAGVAAIGTGTSGVALWAHLGGFAAGLALATVLRTRRRRPW